MPVGYGINGADTRAVYSMVGNASKIYAGGDFWYSGNIVEWENNLWTTLGVGVEGVVNVIEIFGQDLVVGGSYSISGGQNVSNVAKWDGSSWSALGDGVTGSVSALSALGQDLFVGGSFSTAGGQSANSIAKWDGSSWSALGDGVTGGFVNASAVLGQDLFVGGSFSTAGGQSAQRIAKWDGASWSALGIGIDGLQVSAITVASSKVLVGGSFIRAGGKDVSNLAMWDGISWNVVGDSANGAVYALTTIDSEVYAGGAMPSFNLIARVYTEWTALQNAGDDSDGNVGGLAMIGSDLYVGGQFSAIGGLEANNVAMWDGNEWRAMGSGVLGVGKNPVVNAVAVMGSDVYVGGTLSVAGGNTVNNVAKWDGSTWSGLGEGVRWETGAFSSVYAMAVIGSRLYVGGAFGAAGNTNASNVAMWDGSTWSALGTGVRGYGTSNERPVLAMAAMGDSLYVGGSFVGAGSVQASNVARWDGVSWTSLSGGVSGHGSVSAVNALAVVGSKLFVGGLFTTAGYSDVENAANVAVWDGTNWSPLGEGIPGLQAVLSFAEFGPYVLVAGQFGRVDGQNAGGLAFWDGQRWFVPGNDLYGNAYPAIGSLAVTGNSSVYLGGYFTRVDDEKAVNLILYHPLLRYAPQPASSLITLPSKPLNRAGVVSQSVVLIGLVAAVGAVLFVLLLARSRSSWCTEKLQFCDFLTLGHDSEVNVPVVPRQTSFGGLLSIIMFIVLLGAVIVNILPFFQPIVTNNGLIPEFQAKVRSASTTFQLGITMTSIVPAMCPNEDVIFSVPDSWTVHRDVAPGQSDYACAFFATCANCSTTEPVSVRIQIPFYYNPVSIAIGAPLAFFPGDPAQRNVLEHVWSTSSTKFASDAQIQVSLATNVLAEDGKDPATGCILTLNSATTTVSTDPTTTKMTITLQPSGFTLQTDYANLQAATIQITSILIATISGIAESEDAEEEEGDEEGNPQPPQPVPVGARHADLHLDTKFLHSGHHVPIVFQSGGPSGSGSLITSGNVAADLAPRRGDYLTAFVLRRDWTRLILFHEKSEWQFGIVRARLVDREKEKEKEEQEEDEEDEEEGVAPDSNGIWSAMVAVVAGYVRDKFEYLTGSGEELVRIRIEIERAALPLSSSFTHDGRRTAVHRRQPFRVAVVCHKASGRFRSILLCQDDFVVASKSDRSKNAVEEDKLEEEEEDEKRDFTEQRQKERKERVQAPLLYDDDVDEEQKGEDDQDTSEFVSEGGMPMEYVGHDTEESAGSSRSARAHRRSSRRSAKKGSYTSNGSHAGGSKTSSLVAGATGVPQYRSTAGKDTLGSCSQPPQTLGRSLERWFFNTRLEEYSKPPKNADQKRVSEHSESGVTEFVRRRLQRRRLDGSSRSQPGSLDVVAEHPEEVEEEEEEEEDEELQESDKRAGQKRKRSHK